MKVLTPQQIWENFDRKLDDLNISFIKTIKDSKKNTTNYLYFNGPKENNSFTRVYCKITSPPKPTDTIIFIMADSFKDIDDADIQIFLDRGWATLVVDYAGFNENRERFTLYPKAFDNANYFKHSDNLYDFTIDPQKTCWYIWEQVALRSITLLEYFSYSKICMVGVGNGASQVYKTLYLEDSLICGFTLYSIGCNDLLDATTDDLEKLRFKTSLYSANYTSHLNSPLFIQVTSNEENGMLDYMNNLYFNSCDGTLLAISDRSNRSLNSDHLNNIFLWLENNLNSNPLPKEPLIEAMGSQGHLYYSLKADTSQEIKSVDLFFSISQVNPAYRNWRKYSMELVSNGEYLKKVDVFSSTEPVYAFCNVNYANGMTISSMIHQKVPSLLSVNSDNIKFKRLVYDTDMGINDWICLDDNSNTQEKISLVNGLHEIEGVKSISNTLSTFKLADIQYQGHDDNLLQITLSTKHDQIINFSITKAPDYTKYTCQKDIKEIEGWKKFTLSYTDFRSNKGSLEDWSNIVTFSISSENKTDFLLNSMLWV